MSEPIWLNPLVSVDLALFSIHNDRLNVLVVQRQEGPHAAQWALPGGILRPDLDDCLLSTVRRVMQEKIKVHLPEIQEVRTFSGTKRDPRGWSLSVLHRALLPMDQVSALAGRDVGAVQWQAVEDGQQGLAFDHDDMLSRALEQLRADIRDRNRLPLHMLPPKFTISQLQAVCEAILNQRLDKSAFRRRLTQYNEADMEMIDGAFVKGAQRPAQLWKMRSH